LYAHIAGLKVLSAGTHEDARGMLLTSLQSPDPVIIFEYTFLLNKEASIAANAGAVDITHAKVLREGKDISLITYGAAVYKTLDAANELAAMGINAEVIDLRVLHPLDLETVFNSVRKTHRALLVEEAWGSVNITSEVSARIMENIFYELDAPVQRVCGVEVPIPYPKHLEEASVPQQKDIVNRVKKILQHD
jgi:pyruvate dehydrogenase E1 component beta subunit